MVVSKKQSMPNLPKNKHFLLPDPQMNVTDGLVAIRYKLLTSFPKSSKNVRVLSKPISNFTIIKLTDQFKIY